MNWLDAMGVPPQLRGRLLGLPPMGARDEHPNNGNGASEDQAWAAAHQHGYGQVDAPSPWGYNRDVFDAQHPDYSGGHYNPHSGFYDSPTDVPFTVNGPRGAELIGTGREPYSLGGAHSSSGGTMLADQSPSWMPQSPETSGAMAGLPSGGDGGAVPQSNAGGMADLPQGGDSGGGFDLGAFLSALADAYGQGNDPASSGQA